MISGFVQEESPFQWGTTFWGQTHVGNSKTWLNGPKTSFCCLQLLTVKQLRKKQLPAGKHHSSKRRASTKTTLKNCRDSVAGHYWQ